VIEVNKDADAPLYGLIVAIPSHLKLTTTDGVARVEALAAGDCSCGFVFEGAEADARMFMARCAVREPHPKIIDETVPDVLTDQLPGKGKKGRP
jgi:hypothetical protein